MHFLMFAPTYAIQSCKKHRNTTQTVVLLFALHVLAAFVDRLVPAGGPPVQAV